MALRLKTIEYWYNELETLADLTDTNFTQLTINIPEYNGSTTFRSVVTDIVVQDGATTVSNINRRQSSIQLGSAGYSAVNNTNLVTASGENKWVSHSADFTAYFNTNWSGTSMTCDARLLIDSAGTSVWKSATCKLTITYEYDDTASTTQIKTVRIPLNAPSTAMTTTQPGIAIDTIPALDTWLPEASKTIYQSTIVIQGNEESGATVDMSLSMRLDTDTTRTTQLHEKGSNAASWYRHVWQPTFTTNSTHDFYIWASATDFDHPQIWMVVTYSFDASTTTQVMNSLVLPMEFESPMGGPTSADYQRATRELWIEEPDTISIQACALYLHWDQAAAIAGGVGARVGTGAFTVYTSVAATLAGGCGAMIRCESAMTLSRGRNTLQADIYRTDSTNLGWNVSSWWIINYTSGVHPSGVGLHNHTIFWNLFAHGTSTADNNRTTPVFAPTIPETDWFMNALGMNYQYLTNTTGNPAGVVVQVERLIAEGGIKWETIYSDIAHTDPEQGIRQVWATARSVFKRWSAEPDIDRLALQTERRYKAYLNQGANSWDHLDLVFTYHSITFDVVGGVSGYAGDGLGIYVRIWRTNVSTTMALISEEVTGVGGTWSIKWYDNTDEIKVTASQPERGIVFPHFDIYS